VVNPDVRFATRVKIIDRFCLLKYNRVGVPQRWWAGNRAKVTLMVGDAFT